MQNSINRKLLHLELFQNPLSLDLYQNFKRGSEATNISKYSSLKNIGTSHKENYLQRQSRKNVME